MTFPVQRKLENNVLFIFFLLIPLLCIEKPVSGAQKVTLNRSRVLLIKDVILASDTPGIIKSVNVKEGGLLKQGQIVIQLKDEMAQARLKIVEEKAKDDIDVQYSRKAWEVARVEYLMAMDTNKQYEKILPEKIIPILELKKLELSEQKSQLQIQKSEHDFIIAGLELDQAKEELNKFRILAPFSGIVTKILKHPGEAVRQGEPILELVNTDIVRVEGGLPFKYIDRVKIGQKMIVQNISTKVIESSKTNEFTKSERTNTEISKKVFKGKISFIDVKVNPGNGKVTIWAEIENQDNLLLEGLYTEMVIELN